MLKLLFIALACIAAVVNSSISLGQSLENVKVGIPSPSLSVLALRTAQVKNFFREEGLDVSLIQLPTNVTIAALTTKEVDYATASVAAMRSAISGLPVKTVMFVVRSVACSGGATGDQFSSRLAWKDRRHRRL